MEKRMQKLARKLHKASLEAEECCKYQKEIDECRKSAKLLKKDNDELRKKLKQLTDKEKEYEAVIAREKYQQERLDECELRCTTANRTVGKLKDDMNSLQEHFRIKETDYAASFAVKRDRICELEKRLKESISRCTTANSTVEKLNEDMNSLLNYAASLAEKRDRICELEKRLKESASRCTTVNITIEKLKEDMNSLREHFRIKEMDYEASLAVKRDRICELEKRLKESASRFTTVNRTVEKLNEDMNSLREHFRVKDTEYQASIFYRRKRIVEPKQGLRERKPVWKEDAERKRNNDISEERYSTNVAEMYKHVYDNAWADAYENLELQGFKENKIIEIHLQILKNVMEFCHSQSEQQNNNLQRDLLLSEKRADSELSPATLKQVEKCKKESSTVAMEHLFEMYISKIDESADSVDTISLKIKPYVMECIKTCWLCVIHHPPMQIDFESNVRGRPFNENVYNYYTKSGNSINFIIWPPLLLCKNGPVLVKGVAQGIGFTSTPVSRSQSFGKIPVVKYEPMENHCTRWSSNPYLSR